MQNTEKCGTGRTGQRVEVQCEPLPVFNRTFLESVRRAFKSAASSPFQQAWLLETEAGFSPGGVRLGWRERSLMVFARMTGLDIFDQATGPNQRMWEPGDILEMFFKSAETKRHVEFQAARIINICNCIFPASVPLNGRGKCEGL